MVTHQLIMVLWSNREGSPYIFIYCFGFEDVFHLKRYEIASLIQNPISNVNLFRVPFMVTRSLMPNGATELPPKSNVAVIAGLYKHPSYPVRDFLHSQFSIDCSKIRYSHRPVLPVEHIFFSHFLR